MEALFDLWFPIVVSAAAVWVASALAWMVMPHHKGEMKKIPNEDGLLEFVRSNAVRPGLYVFPFCENPAEMKNDAALKARMDAGPWGTVNVFKGWGNMGAKMGLSLAFYVLVSVTVAYLATMTNLAAPSEMTAGPDFMEVFRFTGTAAIAMYAFGRIPTDIWFNTPGRAVAMNLVDCVVYGVITGVVFGLLW